MSRRRSRRQRLPAEPVALDITALSHEGRGVAHVDGKVCFVDGALPEESVQAQYVRRRSQLDELRVVSVASNNPARVSPPCEYSDVCGGCSLQHFDTDAQLAFKESVLLELLANSTGLSADQFTVLPRLHGPTQHYRRKARLAVRVVTKKGGALVGFREKYSSFITDMHNCQVLVKEVAELIDPLRELISALPTRYEIPQIEVAVGEREANSDALQVALVVRHLSPLQADDLLALREFAGKYDLALYLQPKGLDTVHKIYPDDKQDLLDYYLPEAGLQLQFHPMDFTQINGAINRKIIAKALELLELDSSDSVLDLFCGLGNFTLPIAKQAGSVLGVEGSEQMVQRGKANAELNGMQNAEFAAADLTKPLQEQPWLPGKVNKVLLDPPRSGALEIVEQIALLEPERIVYVSCNPATLARDTQCLLERGYKLKSAGVMDMFPHTTHVESMALFVRNH